MSPPRPKTSRQSETRAVGSYDLALFFGVFLIGVFAIFLMKALDAHRYLLAIVPCILLLSYAAIIFSIPKFRIRGDQAGDNCYYLGFLFTLSSLAIALFDFVAIGRVVENIIEDFGVALASTIVGLALRIGFSQLHQNPLEMERDAHIELSNATQRLRSELDQSVREMNNFRRTIQQTITEGQTDFHKRSSEVMGRTLDRYDEITRGSAERIDHSLAGFTANAEKLNKVVERVATSIDSLKDRIEEMETPNNWVEEKLSPVATSIAEIADSLNRRSEQESTEFAQLRLMIEAASGSMSELEKEVNIMAGILNKMQDFGNTMATTGKHLNTFSTNLEKISTSISDETSRLNSAAERTSSDIATTGDEFKALNEPARQAVVALKEIVAQAENLRDIDTQLKTITKRLDSGNTGSWKKTKSLARKASTIFRTSR